MKITSKVIPLRIENIDTDQLIPAQFLKQTTKTGFGKNLFYNWRYFDNYIYNPSFELNNPKREGAQILIGGKNFGCGSSREHAAWAISDYGFKVVISSKFADIHKENLYNNSVVPVEIPEEIVEQLLNYFLQFDEEELVVDIKSQFVEVTELSLKINFEIPPLKKQCIMEGLDETQYLIRLKDKITEFELTNY
ncbi:MAG: 3-isopropylmalate dehydratase small subunit [Flavobacteriales bacterium]|nr:3-isopropylmalate dehydratase small subunit [Flavobacteriales bacterium]